MFKAPILKVTQQADKIIVINTMDNFNCKVSPNVVIAGGIKISSTEPMSFQISGIDTWCIYTDISFFQKIKTIWDFAKLIFQKNKVNNK